MACGVAAVAALMAAAAVAMHWMNRGVETQGLKTELWMATVLQTLTWSAAGALIVTKRPRNPFGWTFCGASLAAAVTALGNEYAVYALVTPGRDVPGGQWVLWVTTWTWVLYVGVIPVVLLVFPDGRLLSRRWAPVLATAITATSVLLVAHLLRPGNLVAETTSLSVDNPVGVEHWGAALTRAGFIADTLLDVVLAIGVVSLLLRFRRARGDERLQLKWLASVAVFLPVTMVVTYVAPGMESSLAFKLHMALLIGTITVAVLKYRLYDIDVILNRSLVYTTLTVLVLGIYVAVVAVSGALLQARAGLVPSLVATGVVAAAFSPLRHRLQSGVNRLLYGGRDEPYEVLSQLGQRLESTLAVDEVLPRLVETVAQTLKLPYVAVEVPHPASRDDDEADGLETVTSYGRASPIALRLPLQYQGASVGALAIAARADCDAITSGPRDTVPREALITYIRRELYARIEQCVSNPELRGASLAERLAEGAVLPMFGMPSRTRELYHNITKDRGTLKLHTIDRELELAISEFAPGSEKTKDKRVLKPIGFTADLVVRGGSVVPVDEEPLVERGWMARCLNCQHTTIPEQEPEGDPPVCDNCGAGTNDPYPLRIFRMAVPKAFRTAFGRGADAAEENQFLVGRSIEFHGLGPCGGRASSGDKLRTRVERTWLGVSS